MSPLSIKAPNADSIWDIWKQKNSRDLEKHFAVKGAKFTPENVTGAEFIKSVEKNILFVVDQTISTKVGGKSETNKDDIQKILKMRWFGFEVRPVKDQWKHGDKLPDVDSLTPIKCPKCGGKLGPKCKKCGGNRLIKCAKCNGNQINCSECNGSGKQSEELDVILGNNDHKKKKLEFACSKCFGTGKVICSDCGGSGKVVCSACNGAGREKCSECSGIGVIYQYQIIPTPYLESKNVETLLIASVKTQEIERNFGKDMHKLLDNAEFIPLKDPNSDLNPKFFEATIGTMSKEIKKAIEEVQKVWESAKKTKNETIGLPIRVYLLTHLNCETNKGKKFSIFAIGTDARFIIASDL
jgi:hypothetical protein